ncbi:MAG: dicarboxylate/amino acid:cation symporter [Gammaproteobacteria bacterium]|nr:dicarboxylate/amino acid:cation symporter [Gammaproteobacteria bacterium]
MSDVDTRLANRILLGLGVGVAAGGLTLLAGAAFPPLLAGARELARLVLEPFGQVFLRLLFFVVIPLVFASLASGVAQLERLAHLGPLALRTFTLFLLNMGIAVALGLVMMNLLEPGATLEPEAQSSLAAQYGQQAQATLERRADQPVTPMSVVEMFMPRNLFGAFVGNDRDRLGDALPLIVFAILVGAAAVGLQPDERERLRSGLQLVSDLMTRIVHYALLLAPFAVPAMIYSVIVRIGWDIVVALGAFVLGCLVVMALHLFGTMSLWLRLFTRRRPREFWRALRPVLVTAFSTSSSAATLPTALAVARAPLGLRPTVSGFVLPLGATMNMAGTALYEGCVVLFVAQIFGVGLGFGQQLTLLLLAVISAIAVAGIPGGSLPLIAGLLVAFGIPPEGIGIILGVDRLLDMARTTVNVGADLVTAAIVDQRANGPEPAAPG